MNEQQRQLLARHIDDVYNIARRMHRLFYRYMDFEECLSAAQLGACEAASKFDPEHGVPFGAWIRSRAVGNIYDDVRRKKGRNNTAKNDAVFEPLDDDQLLDDPVDVVAEKDALDALVRRVAPLYDRRRMIAYMLSEGLEWGEMAEACGCCKATIGTILREMRGANAAA